ncbi:MAG TPA: sulfite reductase, partial [Bacillales bacterium]|nr:sulfite reductase [Bacillales bacterium]
MGDNGFLEQPGKPSEMEQIKEDSRYLRGTIAEGLKDPITGALSEDDNKLLKFHGSYQQDDRDLRNERRRQKLEPAYQFMLRVRAAGGVADAKQWLAIDEIAQKYADGSIRLTTRQSIQLHGILKRNLKDTIREVNDTLLNTLAACGDVNRNVMCNPNPYQSKVHAEVYEWANKLSEHFLPQTEAYHEIWLDGEKIVDSRGDEEEPIYGRYYLPRKFKIGIAVPPSNDVDVFSQDLGFIAVLENGELQG